MTWDESDSAPVGRGFGAGRGIRPPREDSGSAGFQNGKSDDGGFGSKGFGGRRGGDDGGSRGFGGGGRRGDDDGGSRGGFGGRRGGDDEGGSRGFGGRRGGDDEGGSRGFGGRRGGDDEGGNRGFGGGRRGGDDDGGSRGFGGGRRGGDDDGGSRGFGGRKGGDDDGGSRGFGGRRGGDDEGGSRGFGGRKGGDDDGGSRGFGGRRGGDDEGGSRGGFGGGGGRRGGDDDGGSRGFGGRRGGDDDGGSRGGFGGGGRRGGDDEDGGGRGGGRRGGDGEDGEEKPRPPPYVPPESNDDELFGAGTSAGINFDKYDKIQVKVSGANPVDPISTFADAGLRELILANVEKSGYKKPTPVQKYSLPFIMAGRDLMACAQTGSGKTAGFLLPIINGILASGNELIADGSHTEPHAVIISPTRELTQQIFDEARKFALGSICTVAIAYGATAVFHQAKKIMAGCHILVATPGRLLDFVDRGRVTFSSIKYVVLDEGDRMLDMGFMKDVEKMMNHPTMPPVGSRQTLLFSATFPEEIQKLATKFLQDYLFLAVGIVGGACSDVTQKFYEVSKFDKRAKLEEVLREDGDSNKVLVFVETKRNADYIAAYCAGKGFPTTSIHGDREQREREEALRDFKSGRKRVLVATAVGARGLDMKVDHVVNFDLPKEVDEYVHKIGRTGRVGNKGKATSFYDPDQDRNLAADLVHVLEQAEQEVPDFLKSAGAGGGGGGFSGGSGFGGRDIRRNQDSANGNAGGAAEAEEDW